MRQQRPTHDQLLVELRAHARALQGLRRKVRRLERSWRAVADQAEALWANEELPPSLLSADEIALIRRHADALRNCLR